MGLQRRRHSPATTGISAEYRRRSAQRRLRNVLVGCVITAASIITVIYVINQRTNGTDVGSPASTAIPGDPDASFEELKARWNQLSERWDKELELARETGPWWTDRDQDAFRILQSVARRLERLRRAEARGEDWEIRLEREELQKDEREWHALVTNVKRQQGPAK